MDNDQQAALLMNALMGIKQDIGELKQISFAHGQAFTVHCASDEVMAQDILKLKLTAEHDRGSRRAITTLIHALGTIIGAVAGFFGAKHLA